MSGPGVYVSACACVGCLSLARYWVTGSCTGTSVLEVRDEHKHCCELSCFAAYVSAVRIPAACMFPARSALPCCPAQPEAHAPLRVAGHRLSFRISAYAARAARQTPVNACLGPTTSGQGLFDWKRRAGRRSGQTTGAERSGRIERIQGDTFQFHSLDTCPPVLFGSGPAMPF